jgi:serine/threonine protein kinase
MIWILPAAHYWSLLLSPLQVTKYVEREILNHRCLVHPHIVQFKEVRLSVLSNCCPPDPAGWTHLYCTIDCMHLAQLASAPTCLHKHKLQKHLHAWTMWLCCPQVFLTPQHLGIAMEFASGGDMFEYVVKKNGLREEEARWFFQQLIVGLDYCHRMVRMLGRPGE